MALPVLLLILGTHLPVSDGGVIAGGDIILNEFMAEPLQSSCEATGEWLELYNRSGNWINLSGWTIENELQQSIVLPTYLIPPEGYFVLCGCGDPDLNGGLSPDFVFSSFRIQNTGTILLRNSAKQVVDEVIYDEGWPVWPGSSCERINPGWVSSLPSTWAMATTPFGDGDYGTPGQINSVYENSFAQNSWAFIKAFVQ
jgi:hypothetical protein